MCVCVCRERARWQIAAGSLLAPGSQSHSGTPGGDVVVVPSCGRSVGGGVAAPIQTAAAAHRVLLIDGAHCQAARCKS